MTFFTFMFFGRKHGFRSRFYVPTMQFPVGRAGKQVLSVGREGGFESLTSDIGMTSEGVRDMTSERVDESNGRSVGVYENRSSVRRELKSRPVGAVLFRRSRCRRVHEEVTERPFVVRTQVVQLYALGVYASGEDQTLGIECRDLLRIYSRKEEAANQI